MRSDYRYKAGQGKLKNVIFLHYFQFSFELANAKQSNRPKYPQRKSIKPAS
ncbi:hypothetical protein OAG1_26970 [Agarivorans sp. OAG1]|nr:hypothetical protein OAG1_26970 [Agarivorans sp. OAG1]